MIKKKHNLTENAKMCIAKYKIIHKRLIREAKRMQITIIKLYGRL